jgi:hypothetical protein
MKFSRQTTLFLAVACFGVVLAIVGVAVAVIARSLH